MYLTVWESNVTVAVACSSHMLKF